MTKSFLIKLSEHTETLEDKLPKRIKMFDAGPNLSSKGTHVYDPSMKNEILAAYVDHGVERLSIDVDHKSLNPMLGELEAGAAVGWFTLEVDDEGIWAADVEWTPRGKEFLLNQEFKYISPAFNTAIQPVLDENGEPILDMWGDQMMQDKLNEDGHLLVSEIVNLSITNHPASKNTPSLLNKLLNLFKKTEDFNKKAEIMTIKQEETKQTEETKKLNDVGQEEDSTEDNIDELIVALQQTKEEQSQKILELEATITELSNQIAEAEKESLVAQLSNVDEKEMAFVRTLSKDKIEEYVAIKLSQQDEKESVVPAVKKEESEELSAKAPHETLKLSSTETSSNIKTLSKEEIEKRVNKAWARAKGFQK